MAKMYRLLAVLILMLYPAFCFASRPDIIFVLTDDLNKRAVDYLPRTAALRDAGANFTNAFSTTALCCPARSSILTGLYVHNHKVTTNKSETGGGFERFLAEGLEDTALPIHLKSVGYRTALIGKYLNEYNSIHIPPGWDEWVADVPYPGNASRYTTAVNHNGIIMPQSGSYYTDVLADYAVKFLTETPADVPVFVYFSPSSPHSPMREAVRYRGAFDGTIFHWPLNFNEADVSDKAMYGAGSNRLLWKFGALEAIYRVRLSMMLSVEDAIDRMRAARPGAIVIFTSDNGFFVGEHRYSRGKSLPYDEAIAIPFYMVGPGFTAGRQVNKLVAIHDIFPTVLDLAGASISQNIDGRSLVPLAHGEVITHWRRAILLESWGGNSYGNKSWEGIRTRNKKFIKYLSTRECELFRLRKDPYEMNGTCKLRNSILSRWLDSLRDCTSGIGCQTAELSPP